MKNYKYFIKSLESILEDTLVNRKLIEHAAWGNGYVVIPMNHPFAGMEQYEKDIVGCYEIDFSAPVEKKMDWEELNDSDKGSWLLGISLGGRFQDGVEITKEYVERETIKLRDELMKLS